jgi:hypothetical protein
MWRESPQEEYALLSVRVEHFDFAIGEWVSVAL